TKPR
uniref:Phagocytosis-stimulating peptide n=1 Tax=Homo sapiens TaxID=9606 RepID=TUFT_HUMAN